MATEIVRSSTPLPDSLDALAEIATAEHEACEQAARDSVAHAVRAGEALIEAKSRVRHGEWLPWLGELGLPRTTTAAYMRLARNVQRVAHLETPTLRGALAEIAKPRERGEHDEPEEVEPESEPEEVEPEPEPTTTTVTDESGEEIEAEVLPPASEGEAPDGSSNGAIDLFGGYLGNCARAAEFADDAADEEVIRYMEPELIEGWRALAITTCGRLKSVIDKLDDWSQ